MYIGAVVPLCAVNCVFYMDRIKSRPTLETPHTCIIVSAICNYFALCKIIQCKKKQNVVHAVGVRIKLRF